MLSARNKKYRKVGNKYYEVFPITLLGPFVHYWLSLHLRFYVPFCFPLRTSGTVCIVAPLCFVLI